MPPLADAVLSALKGFATEVSTWTNQGTLLSIEGHIAQIANAAAEDVHAGETAAKAVLADLYSAFHGREATPAPAQAEPAPTLVPTAASSAVTTAVAPPVPPTMVGGPGVTSAVAAPAAPVEPLATGGLIGGPTVEPAAQAPAAPSTPEA